MARSLLAGLVAALATILPATAWAQDGPTLTFDKQCYAAGDSMGYTGSGFTPNGEVNFLFNSLSNSRVGSYNTRADPAGAITGSITAPGEDDFLDADDFDGVVGATANDKARIDQGVPPEQQFGATVFRFTRWGVSVGRPGGGGPKSARPMRVLAYGFTRAVGETLYVQYRRGGRVRRAVRLGRLGGECGDLTRTVRRALPRGLRPGRYSLMFTTSPHRTDGERVMLSRRFR